MKEIWKDIPGYERRYQASDFGKIRSLIKWNGTNERILRPATKKDKHLHVSLYKNKKGKMHLVHVLILETFIGRRPSGKECLHIDGNPQNNRLNNLRYGTHKENMEDCSKHGGFGNRKGINNSNAKFTNKKAKEVRKLYKKGNITQLQLAKQFNVGEYAIWCIVNNKTWNDKEENNGKQ